LLDSLLQEQYLQIRMEENPEGDRVAKLVPTCFEGHPLKLGSAIGGSGQYRCNLCRDTYSMQSSSWRCQEDFRRGGGNCNFDLCVPCMKARGEAHIAAWPIIIKLGQLINLNYHPTPTEEEYADFKRMIKPIPPQLVDQIDYDNEGNLLQYAVKMNQTGYLQILIDYGLDPMAPLAFRRPLMSPLEEAIERGHMEVWSILKEHIEMTDELKLEQLYNMITTGYRYREEPHTEFKELLASMPVESVKPFRLIAMGDPPTTSTLLQAAAQHDNKEAVLLLLEHGVDPKETSDIKKTPMKLAAENNHEEIVEILRKAIGEEIPDDVKLQQLSKTMYGPYEDDKEKAKDKFRELLSSLPPELVSSTSVNDYGSVLQDAVLEGKTDFIRLLLEHGVDPTVGTDAKEKTSIEIAADKDSTEVLTLLAEFTELPTEIKIKQLKLLIDSEGEGNLDIFKKLLESLSADELAAARIRVQWLPDFDWKDASLLQSLANQCDQESKLNLLELLLNHGLDPMAVTEEVADTPLEIVAFSGNLKAFDLIAPHYEDNIKKQIAQLLIWALTDKTPSAAFMFLFESVTMAEVQCFMILKVITQ